MTRATNAPHHPAVRLDDVRNMAGNESQVHLALYRGAKPQCT
ncbi:chitooligosaccharide deacetylase, partial [Cutibacterium acnes]